MRTFVIGCTHFGHENIIRLAQRPFVCLQEMDDVMIQRWNNAHTHKSELVSAERRFNVCAEAVNYMPMPLDAIIVKAGF